MFMSFWAPFETMIYQIRSYGAFNTQLMFDELQVNVFTVEYMVI